MIKKILISSSILVLSTGSASSGVISNTTVSVSPPEWIGFYAGLNAGGIWSGNSKSRVLSSFVPGSQTPLSPNGATYTGVQSALGASGIISTSNGGFNGGGQVGYNWQFTDHLFYGLEADFQGIATGHNNAQTSSIVPLVGTFDGGSTTYIPGEFFETLLKSNKRTDYFGTLRGRLGGLATPTLLLHGTAGLAYGGVSSWTSITQTNNDSTLFAPAFSLTPKSVNSGSYSNTRFGWTVGADAEWMFKPNWSAKLEYLYYDLGRVSYAVSPTLITIPALAQPIAVVTSQVSTRFNGNIIRAGINYHFNF
ncbi:MAG: outer membrane beta-barrel protein [Legionella sp.]|nr:outer membrane beta-barrel protein [Legionella sp.]